MGPANQLAISSQEEQYVNKRSQTSFPVSRTVSSKKKGLWDMMEGLAFSHFAQSKLCWCSVRRATRSKAVHLVLWWSLLSDPVNRSRKSWCTVVSVSVHADDISPIREHTLGAQWGPSHVCFHRLFFFLFFPYQIWYFREPTHPRSQWEELILLKVTPTPELNEWHLEYNFLFFTIFFERHYSSRLNCAHFFCACNHTRTQRCL